MEYLREDIIEGQTCLCNSEGAELTYGYTMRDAKAWLREEVSVADEFED
ncbi:hypothetical protein [Pedobacter rhizosphaerae]|uniref:Uncharacterized protein n=1 Tax=Pedobacter rhizosphaerae TaxID=390241 RepID=A0A1H9QVQ6_9SPHI|nr:hypothetical protein [Pedobacter rhizosphaerae]SER64538.1 hypothetical protein SAMN04488023_1135 [Pedobacter rhizosphaerae]